jgi:hypothetical protein
LVKDLRGPRLLVSSPPSKRNRGRVSPWVRGKNKGKGGHFSLPLWKRRTPWLATARNPTKLVD